MTLVEMKKRNWVLWWRESVVEAAVGSRAVRPALKDLMERR